MVVVAPTISDIEAAEIIKGRQCDMYQVISQHIIHNVIITQNSR